MSFAGWIGNRVMARIEAIPSVRAAVEREERTRPVIQAAMGLAYSKLGDAAAKAELADRLTGKSEAVVEALTVPWLLERRDFASDRAYRLLAAIASNADVEPMPGWRASLFREEDELGRMSLEQAFRHLTDIEPRLLNAEQMAKAPVNRDDGEISRALKMLVGGGAERENQLLRSNLASSIAHHYLWILLGADAFGNREMSYFDAPRKMAVATAVFGGGSQGPTGRGG